MFSPLVAQSFPARKDPGTRITSRYCYGALVDVAMLPSCFTIDITNQGIATGLSALLMGTILELSRAVSRRPSLYQPSLYTDLKSLGPRRWTELSRRPQPQSVIVHEHASRLTPLGSPASFGTVASEPSTLSTAIHVMGHQVFRVHLQMKTG